MTKEKLKKELKKISMNNTFKVLEAFKKSTYLNEKQLNNIKRRVMAINTLNNINKVKTTQKELLFVYDSETFS